VIRRRRIAAVLAAVFVLAGCGGIDDPTVGGGAVGPTTTAVPTSASSSASAAKPSASSSTKAKPKQDCPYPASGFDCDQQKRFAAAEAYVKKRPGTVGIVVRDRQTGAVWRNGHADEHVWTASTIKLAMTVNLLLRDRDGDITLTSGDRGLIERMLHSSDDEAADSLWFKYAGGDHMTFNNAFPAYGMKSVLPQRGFTKFYPYWGFQKCTPQDLDGLINYVLTKLPSDLRGYIVPKMRAVAANQQWGVWGAGSAAQPGNKDGWSQEQGGWVMNSVGFVGPGERYTLAVMNSLRGEGGYDEGKETDTQVAALLFKGRF
jgi:hypothetical protein